LWDWLGVQVLQLKQLSDSTVTLAKKLKLKTTLLFLVKLQYRVTTTQSNNRIWREQVWPITAGTTNSGKNEMVKKFNVNTYLVKSLMVLGNLCLFSNVNAQSWEKTSMVGILINSHVSAQDTVLHGQAVYHALNNLENGEVVEWYNDARGSHGKAFVVVTYPARAGQCRRVYSYMRINRNSYSYTDTACLDNNRRTWTFVDKY
jgi:surface antigen